MAELSKLLENPKYHQMTGSTSDLSFIGVYATDLLSTAIKHMKPNMALITLISSASTLNLAVMLDIEIVILTQDADITEAFVEKANIAQITVIKTDYLTHEVIIDMIQRGLI